MNEYVSTITCPACGWERPFCQCLSLKEWQLTVGPVRGVRRWVLQEKDKFFYRFGLKVRLDPTHRTFKLQPSNYPKLSWKHGHLQFWNLSITW